MNYPSETAKYRDLTVPYCNGCGIDIASQGDPVVPWAWQLDLPSTEFDHYNSNHPPRGPIQIRGHGNCLPVESDSLDFVYSSHLLEDYADWLPVLQEWGRVVKPGGCLIILLPDRARWIAACEAGQPPNDAHRHEANGPEELEPYAEKIGFKVLRCGFTDIHPGDYTILAVFQKPRT